MDYKQCPLYGQCQNVTDKFVTKEICDFRWDIIKKDLEQQEKSNERITNVEKDIEFMKESAKNFELFNISIGKRQGVVESKIGEVISRNTMIDKQKKINDENKKRKQNIRDTIITTVITAFIIGTLAGGWELFKKVSIILEKTQTITQPITPKK